MGQGDKVGVIGQGKEYGYEDYGPLPLEGGGAVSGGPPQGKEDYRHEGQLVKVAPGLHEHVVESAQQVFVKQGAHGSQDGSHNNAEHPFVLVERNTLFLAANAKQVERYHGNNDTNPLVKVKPLAKQQQTAQQHNDGAGCVDGAKQGDGKVFHAKVAEYPGTQHNERLDNEKAMLLPAGCGNIKDTAVQQSCLGRQERERQH